MRTLEQSTQHLLCCRARQQRATARAFRQQAAAVVPSSPCAMPQRASSFWKKKLCYVLKKINLPLQHSLQLHYYADFGAKSKQTLGTTHTPTRPLVLRVVARLRRRRARVRRRIGCLRVRRVRGLLRRRRRAVRILRRVAATVTRCAARGRSLPVGAAVSARRRRIPSVSAIGRGRLWLSVSTVPAPGGRSVPVRRGRGRRRLLLRHRRRLRERTRAACPRTDDSVCHLHRGWSHDARGQICLRLRRHSSGTAQVSRGKLGG